MNVTYLPAILLVSGMTLLVLVEVMIRYWHPDCRIISLKDGILTMKIDNPLSLFQLREKYGTGESGFDSDDWWLNEDFARDIPEAGIYEIDIRRQITNLTYSDQGENLPEDWNFPHPAILSQVILVYYEKIGNRLLVNWSSRTSKVNSDDDIIVVGPFNSDGLVIDTDLNDYPRSRFGVALSHKKS